MRPIVILLSVSLGTALETAKSNTDFNNVTVATSKNVTFKTDISHPHVVIAVFQRNNERRFT
jgi:hypothetical protein